MLVKQIAKQGLLLKNAGVLSRAAYHGGGHQEHSTMNDLPVPEGDWYEHNAHQNSKYNMFLALGIGSLVGTIALIKSMNLVHFNFSPPKSID